jgi:hypothetical protein
VDADKAVDCLLSGMAPKELMKALPEKITNKIVQSVCDAMTNHWSEARCMNIKTKNLMSRRKYIQLCKALACNWDPAVGGIVRTTI